ncbi:MAG: hypothetical protein Q4C95_03345 [Planctomycetia bacterium]|nr:hypothetical protein [Planctomycetia bacterium]
MQKLKVYLDTSVFGYLYLTKSSEIMQITRDFVELLKKDDHYILCTSIITIREIDCAPEPLKSYLKCDLSKLGTMLLKESKEINQLQAEYLENKLLTPKSIDDLMHISFAVYYQCDIIASWNFKHFVNENTIYHLKRINQRLGLPIVDIVSPRTFMERLTDGNGMDDIIKRNPS